ncbi:MAG: hypothetical protein AB3N23_17395 [Paracoccaceae bacterium]
MLTLIKETAERSAGTLLLDFAGVAALAVIFVAGLHLPVLA